MTAEEAAYLLNRQLSTGWMVYADEMEIVPAWTGSLLVAREAGLDGGKLKTLGLLASNGVEVFWNRKRIRELAARHEETLSATANTQRGLNKGVLAVIASVWPQERADIYAVSGEYQDIGFDGEFPRLVKAIEANPYFSATLKRAGYMNSQGQLDAESLRADLEMAGFIEERDGGKILPVKWQSEFTYPRTLQFDDEDHVIPVVKNRTILHDGRLDTPAKRIISPGGL
jgi:hypothetical protein